VIWSTQINAPGEFLGCAAIVQRFADLTICHPGEIIIDERSIAAGTGGSMPSYQATATKAGIDGIDGKTELIASYEFEASDTEAAKIATDAWSNFTSQVTSAEPTIRLYAGKVLLCERASGGGAWENVNRR
jgi:hypothetical protein